MAAADILLRLQYNHRRAEAMMQAACGEAKRARRNDRPAILARVLKAIMATCVRVVPAQSRPHVSCDCLSCRPWTT